MSDFFFYGPLCHGPQLATLIGREVPVEPARLPGQAIRRVDGQEFPGLFPQADAVAHGQLARGLSAEEAARLAFYAGGLGYLLQPMVVETAGGPVPAQVWVPPAGTRHDGGEWSLDAWVRDWFAIGNATLADEMALYGTRPAEAVMRRHPQMLVRGASRVRAQETAPTTLRHAARPGDMRTAAFRQPYANFFAVEEYDLSFRRFDGSRSPVITRAAFVSGDAVTVLPYDPLRDRVLVVEQFRAGPHARGDAQPWQIEAIAGRIDPGETPEEAARREAVEEAGITLGALLKVAGYYPSPGAKSEFLYSYVALTDLPDTAAGVFGLAEEAEDIRGHLLSFAQMMELVASGEIGNAPLVLTALWLERERPRLRAAG